MSVYKVCGKSEDNHLPSKQKRVLVAGFDAFDKLDANPSQTIVETLGSSIKLPGRKDEVLLDTLVLPTCCNKAWGKLKRKMDANKNQYSAIVLTGVAATREMISLERFALNIRDYRIKDNGGHQYSDAVIEKDAPNALRTSLSVAAMSKALTKKGVVCQVSNHAGTFICNEVYYKCLLYQEKLKRPAQVLFVHLPLPKAYSRARKKLRGPAKQLGSRDSQKGIDQMQSAVERIIAMSVG